MVDKRFVKQDEEEIKKIYIHYLDKRKVLKKSTRISYQKTFGDI